MKNGDDNSERDNINYAIILEAIRTEAKKTREEIKEEIKLENAKLLTKIKEQNLKIANLESKCNELETKNKKLERLCRKNNIIIFGLEIDANANLAQFITQKFRDLLNVNITEDDINNIYQIPKNNLKQIKVEFRSYLKKTLVLQNAIKLKGTQISIAQDLCYEDRQDQKILRKHLTLAKSKNYFAKIKGHKLIINDNVYTAEQLRQTEYELNIDSIDEIDKEEKKGHSAPSTPQIAGKESPKPPAKRKKSEKETQDLSAESCTNSRPRITRLNSQK